MTVCIECRKPAHGMISFLAGSVDDKDSLPYCRFCAAEFDFKFDRQRLYTCEFGPSYWPTLDEVALIQQKGLHDFSYHNDICASWGRELGDGRWIQLFVDCINPDDRENVSAPRFAVNITNGQRGDVCLYEGDDIDVAVRVAQAAEVWDDRTDVEHWAWDDIAPADGMQGCNRIAVPVAAQFESVDYDENPHGFPTIVRGTCEIELHDGVPVDHVINWE